MTNSRRHDYEEVDEEEEEEEEEEDEEEEEEEEEEQAHRKEEEEEEEDQFFETFDRILSCSSSSCSSDNDEGPVAPSHKRNPDYASSSPDQIPPPIRFPMAAVSTYDVWIAEPASVQERRQRLLSQLGLASDKTLSRCGPSISASTPPPQHVHSTRDAADVATARRSASCDQLGQQQQDTSNCQITRSSSDGAATADHCSSNPFSRSSLLPNSAQPEASSPLVHSNHQSQPFTILSKQASSDGPSPSPSKPPSGKFSRRFDEIKTSDHLIANSPSRTPNGSHHQHLDDVDDSDSASGDLDHRVCTIKNLDNGEEFVINEIGEDGMWNKLREVGTGRQLTREEFEMCVVGHSPIVQELMRRQNVEESSGRKKDDMNTVDANGEVTKSRKKGGWFRSIKNVASSVTGHRRERRSSDERDTSSEKGGRRSSSATDDSQDVLLHTPERTKVRYYGKSYKELSALYMSQDIQAHRGSIWSIKFSLDGQYLASAGEDRIIHIWQVIESERRGDLLIERMEEGNSNPFAVVSGSPEPTLLSANGDSNHLEKKKRGKLSYSRKSASLDHVMVPENVFALTEKPICSLQGHLADVLDLSWSKSEYLLSSSMDKTVRLWHLSSRCCLKVFSHSDYVTSIQFNPVDDRYFISGSLDAKVRIWSIPDRQVVDWNDLHEMVTAACYTPDGKGALVGSHKGSCHLYNTSDNKLHQKSQINLQNKKKKSHVKKITGFQFAPGSSSEVLVTSADSRIRVVDGVDLVHKFKGFRNTSSQISAALTTNGKYVVSASEDSHVYIWRYDSDSRPSRGKGINITRSYEHFHCRDVSVAIPWSGILRPQELCNSEQHRRGSSASDPLEPAEGNGHGSPLRNGCTGSSPLPDTMSYPNTSYFSDRVSVTWPEEKLLLSATTNDKKIPQSNGSYHHSARSAWGMVIVTAGLGGEIKTFQNFGLPVRI